jgi:hypothetical protein
MTARALCAKNAYKLKLCHWVYILNKHTRNKLCNNFNYEDRRILNGKNCVTFKLLDINRLNGGSPIPPCLD